MEVTMHKFKIQQLSVKYVKPSYIARQLVGTKKEDTLVPKGLTTLIPSDGDLSLVVSGTPESIEEIKTIVRLMDVQAKVVTAKMRLLQRTSSNKQATVLAEFSLNLANNAVNEMNLLLEGKRVFLSITAHLNGDNSISWFAERALEGESRVKSTQRQKRGTGYICLSDSSTERRTFLQTLENKNIQEGALLPPGDYLEVTPTQIK
jgi:hypothetical protein